jgi:hypothetical protein
MGRGRSVQRGLDLQLTTPFRHGLLSRAGARMTARPGVHTRGRSPPRIVAGNRLPDGRASVDRQGIRQIEAGALR